MQFQNTYFFKSSAYVLKPKMCIYSRGRQCLIATPNVWTSVRGYMSDEINQNDSEVEKYDFFFWHFLLGYCLGFNLVKIPQRLGNWFQRYKQLKDWTNNKKQNKLLALFGCILKNGICEFRLILLDHIKSFNTTFLEGNPWFLKER